MRTIDWRSYTFQDYWHLLTRRKWYIVLPLLASITIATGMAMTSTPKYRAQTTLIVNEVVESGDMIREILNLPRMAREQSLSIHKWIMSRRVLVEAANRARIREYLDSRWAADAVDTTTLGTIKRNLREVLVRLHLKNPRGEVTDTRLVEYLHNIMSVRVQQNFVTITVEHPKPLMAKDIANYIASAYTDYTNNRRSTEVGRTSRFLQEEIIEAKRELDDAEKALRRASEDGLIQSLNEQNVELIDQMTDAEGTTLRLGMQITEKQEEINRLIEKRDTVPASLAQQRETVAQLQREYEEVRQGLSSAFPRVARKEREVNEAKVQLGLMEKQFEVTQTESETKLKQAREDLTELQIAQKTAERRRRQYQEAINRLPDDVTSLSNLIMQKRLAEEAYGFLEQKRYETEYLQSNVQNETGKVVVPLDLAEKPDVPINSSTGMVIGGGIVIGLGLGVALVLVLEYFSHAVNSVKEAEQYFKGVPVVGVVPRLRFSK